MMRVAVLASGSGSNFQALVERLRVNGRAGVVHLVCNVPGAGVLTRAERLGVPVTVLDHRAFAERAAFDQAVVDALRPLEIDLVCLAGYLRLVGQPLLRAYPQRILNVHPALLPAFPGLHGARQALAAGVRVSGCTVHLVDDGLDTGPIVAQAAVPVLQGDSEASLIARIQQQEHRLFPLVVEAFADGAVSVQGRTVTLSREFP